MVTQYHCPFAGIACAALRCLTFVLVGICTGPGQQASAETAPSFRWADKIVGSDAMNGIGMAVDAEGNSYLTGNVFDSFTFGNLSVSDTGLFVAKCDQTGRP